VDSTLFHFVPNREEQPRDGASKKREEEMRGKAIKVVDLLQHSAELGHLDALYTLAQILLVRCLLAPSINCTQLIRRLLVSSDYPLPI
jgi:hypothetical protein